MLSKLIFASCVILRSRVLRVVCPHSRYTVRLLYLDLKTEREAGSVRASLWLRREKMQHQTAAGSQRAGPGSLIESKHQTKHTRQVSSWPHHRVSRREFGFRVDKATSSHMYYKYPSVLRTYLRHRHFSRNSSKTKTKI